MEALNYKNIHTYSNSEEMLLVNLLPDIVILDQDMGNNQMKGQYFLIRHKATYFNTHFIFLSSSTKIEIAVDPIKYGAYDYVIKSRVGLERLIVRIEGLIGNQIKNRTRRIIYNAAIVTLGMISLICMVAVFLYTHQII
jgi:DNA-binding NarL/FixJ family response regulator